MKREKSFCRNNAEEFRTATSLTSWRCLLGLVESYKFNWTTSTHIETVNFVVYVLSVQYMLDFKYVTDKTLNDRQNKYMEQLASITNHENMMPLSAKLGCTVHKFYEYKVVRSG